MILKGFSIAKAYFRPESVPLKVLEYDNHLQSRFIKLKWELRSYCRLFGNH